MIMSSETIYIIVFGPTVPTDAGDEPHVSIGYSSTQPDFKKRRIGQSYLKNSVKNI
jgi:hypothetical protein